MQKRDSSPWSTFYPFIYKISFETLFGDIPPLLVINEILADPATDISGDANGDGTRHFQEDEFIEIVNRNGSSIDIGGYTLSDATEIRHTFNSPTVIPNGESVVVFGGGNPIGIPGLVVVASSGVLNLHNTGDVVTLKDNNGILIDSYSYNGTEGEYAASMAREPDYFGSFVKHTSISTNPLLFSPGKANVDGTNLPVELTSFTANLAGGGVLLKWTTATEVNNYGFEVEERVSGIWNKIGFVQGHGNSNSPKEYSFYDNSVALSYRLKQIDTDGGFEYSDVVDVNNLSKEFSLDQNYPNPFNPSTFINFSLPENGLVILKVYDVLGREVATLINQEMVADYHTVEFDASQLTSGIYFYRIQVNNFTSVKKMILMK
jgi:hypothetical protein